MNISAIDVLELIDDGDTVVPGMTFALPEGVGTTQYFNPSTNKVTPDYAQLHDSGTPIRIYPTCYSSRKGAFIQPDTDTVKWYLNSTASEENRILPSGGTENDTSHALSTDERFEISTYSVSGNTYPCLVIKGNLASTTNLTDVLIYCQFTYNNLTITCHATISVKETTGDLYQVLISSISENGMSDTVIDNEGEWLRLTAYLQLNGETVKDVSGTFNWLRATTTGNEVVSHVAGKTAISTQDGSSVKNNVLTLYESGVQGVEEYFAEIAYGNTTYRGSIQVSDVREPYYIEIGRNLVSSFVKESQTVVYTPSVYQRKNGQIDSGWSFTFRCTDDNDFSQQESGDSFEVSGQKVKQYGTLHVHITATKDGV